AGIVSIDETDPRNPELSAVAEGMYEISVTVTDNASNLVTDSIFFEWDTTNPGTPSVSGVNHTANTTPTWTWTSGGGGNGTYQYRLEKDDGSDANYTEIKGWTETDLESYTLEAAYVDDSKRFILYVRETDRAGNLSASGLKKIHTDSLFLALPPSVTLSGGIYDRIIEVNNTDVTWTWNSGLDNILPKTFRYRLDNSDLSGLSASSTTSFSYTFAADGSDDGYHYIYVEEYDNENDAWVELVSSDYVRIDMTAPNPPNLNTPVSPTTDYTPTWSWSSGGGGMGYYRYSTISNSVWQGDTYSNNVTLSKTDGTYNFYLQEMDSAGNWSDSTIAPITIDTTAPTINSFGITSGTLTGEGNRYTSSTTITVSLSASTNDGQPIQMQFYNGGYTGWESYNTSKTLTLPVLEGQKYISVQVKDYLGNVSGWISDTIILDQTAPNVGTVSINGGAVYTPSLNANLTVSSSDNKALNDELEVQYTYYNGSQWVYSLWRALSLGTTFSTENSDNGSVEDIEFTPVAVSKRVYVRFRVPAGNYSTWGSTDTITLQIPEPTYATKGTYTYNGNGKAIVYYSTVTEDSGPNSTYYYTYYTDNPTTDPNNGDSVTLLDGTTLAYNYVYNFGEGELRYFFIRSYNADTGGYGPYSTTSKLGFSSNVTVVYDDTYDVNRAQELKTLLEDGDGRIAQQISSGFVSGTMPDYSVTLLPWDLVSSTYNGSTERIDGTPIIITPQASYELYLHASDNQVRNIVANYNGVIAMGYYSGSFLSRVNSKFSIWSLSGTPPSGIINSMTLTALTTAKPRPFFKSVGTEDVWYTPLAETFYLANGTDLTPDPAIIFSASTGRRGVSLASGLAPTDGAIYAG
ncbi:MAG: hypothetical protein PF495_14385, partial [Spirochaetales bacterium]|nr:hypothetical protein [Spirochaetales bacterium]